MPAYSYSAFGLYFLSDFECPELPECHNPSLTASAIRFRIGISDGDASLVAGPAGKHPFLFALEGIGRYRVFDDEIAIEPTANADWHAIRLFLFSTALGALLHRRSIPVLHASSIVTREGAVIFAGPSGAGKSTLAAGFWQRGYSVLADEMAVLGMEGGIAVQPGTTCVMVWQDALRKLSIDPGKLTAVRPGIQKYFLPLGSFRAAVSAPLRKIYIVEPSHHGQGTLVSLRGVEKFKATMSILFRPELTAQMGMEGRIYPQFAELAAAAEVTRVTTARHPFEPRSLIDRLERDLG